MREFILSFISWAADEAWWMIPNLHGSKNFNVLYHLCFPQDSTCWISVECMIVFMFHLNFCQHVWNSHFEFNDLYKFNLILNLGIVDYKFLSSIELWQWDDSTISFFCVFRCFFSFSASIKWSKLCTQFSFINIIRTCV